MKPNADVYGVKSFAQCISLVITISKDYWVPKNGGSDLFVTLDQWQ